MTNPGPASSEEAAAQLGPPTTFWSPTLEHQNSEGPGLAVWDAHWGVWRALVLGDALGTHAPADAVSLTSEHGGGEAAAPEPVRAAEMRAVLVHASLFEVLRSTLARRGWGLGKTSDLLAEETFIVMPSEVIERG